MPEPQFDVVAADELDAIEAGRAVLTGELDATVRVHPWCPPGQFIVINRAMLPPWARFADEEAGG